MRKSQPRLTKVLVTGATGFVGSNLVKRLLSKNFQVHALVRSTSNTARIVDLLPKLYLYQADLLKIVKLKKIVQKIDPEIIFHLATASVFGSEVVEKSNEIIKTNFLGTVNLVNACNEINYSCFVNTGSSSEYGLKDNPMKEQGVCQPVGLYGFSKLAATLYCQMITRTKNKPIITLRLFSPFGPSDDRRRLIANIIVCALKNRDLALTRPGIVRDYIFVEDVLDAYLACINKARQFAGEIFNIGSGKQQTIGSVAKRILKITNSKSKLMWGKLDISSLEPKLWQADLTKTRKLLGWQPKHSFDEGLKETINWFKNNLKLYS